MKNHFFILTILFTAIFLIAPFMTSAFSFTDIVNFGKKLIRVENQINRVEVKKETVTEPTQFFSDTAVQKFENWENSFKMEGIGRIVCDSRNLYFTETESNHFLAHELAMMDNPPVRDTQISFERDLIKLSGYSMFKTLLGQFYLEIKIIQGKDRFYLKVIKARYRKIYLLPFIAEAILRSQTKDIINFLYSNPDCQDFKITVGDGFIELNYGN